MNFDLIVRRMMGFCLFIFILPPSPFSHHVYTLSFFRPMFLSPGNGIDSTLIQFTVTCYSSPVSLTCDMTYAEL